MKCGETFEAHPPDDFHQVASIKPDEVGDPIKVEYRCKGTAVVVFTCHI